MKCNTGVSKMNSNNYRYLPKTLFTGQPNIIYYASDVFRAVGFCTNWSSTLATVGLGTMKVISTAMSLSIVDKLGRKKCLSVGILIMGLAVLTLGIFASVDGSEASKHTCHEIFINKNYNKSINVNGTTTTSKPLLNISE